MLYNEMSDLHVGVLKLDVLLIYSGMNIYYSWWTNGRITVLSKFKKENLPFIFTIRISHTLYINVGKIILCYS